MTIKKIAIILSTVIYAILMSGPVIALLPVYGWLMGLVAILDGNKIVAATFLAFSYTLFYGMAVSLLIEMKDKK